MALFKKRSSDSSPAASDTTPESTTTYTDPLQRRARHRLIGASILVVVAVLLLPWLFDVKPPTVSSNLPISINGQSDRPSTATTNIALAPAATTASAPPEAVEPDTRTPTQPESVSNNNDRDTAPAPSTPERVAKPQPAAERAPAPKPAKSAEPRKPANIDELIAQRQKQQERAPAAAQNKPAAPAAPSNQQPPTPPVNYNFPDKGRFVVQIGAYVEADKVTNVRKRLSQAGLNNYTQRVTVDGKQVTRVRIGPFTSRKQMEQTASKVRALGLPVSLYQL